MKKITLAFALFVLSASTFAWTIGPMNYQGRLLDNAGIPVTGSYNFNVRIYDALTGGTLKFSEQQNNISVDDGVYSFLVSTGTNPTGSWDINLWNSPSLYLEIEVNGQTLTPRHLLAAAPFAFQANLALTTNNALALGGISASQFQNNLADICTAGKGKWLEIAQKCLGIGASFPGPTMVALSTLTASTDLSGLDLSKADISGIDFGSANFSGSVFKGTKINAPGINNTNMTNAVWDALVIIGIKQFNNNFTGATVSNIDFTGGSLSSAILQGASLADLSGCPTSLPAGYACKGQNNMKYLITGSNLNFSETSLMRNRLNSENLSTRFFDWTNMAGSNFKGNKIETWWVQGANYAGANFEQTDIHFAGVETTNLDNAVFTGSRMRNVYFSYVNMSNVNFYASDLTRVTFLLNPNLGVVPMAFDSALLTDVQFFLSTGTAIELSFSGATLINSAILGATSSVFTEDASFSGGIYFGNQVNGLWFNNPNFNNGNIGGRLVNAGFNAGSFVNVSFNGADLTGSTGMGGATYTNVNWFGAICPDGYQVTALDGTCVGHFLP